MHKYTLIQLSILVVIFVVTLLPYVASLFPLFIALLVPLRLLCFPRSFGKEYTELLDAPDMDKVVVPRGSKDGKYNAQNDAQNGAVELVPVEGL